MSNLERDPLETVLTDPQLPGSVEILEPREVPLGGPRALPVRRTLPQRARSLQLPAGTSGAVITDVDPNGPSAGALRPNDVILSVNRQTVSNATEAGRALQRIETGRIAQILVWRGDTEVFVTVRKE